MIKPILAVLALLALPVDAQQDRPNRLYPTDPDTTKACPPVTPPIINWLLGRVWICQAPVAGANTGSWILIAPSSSSGTSGAVLMTHDLVGGWIVNKPDGTQLSTVGDTCQGLQTAITWGWARAYPVRVVGGGITPPITGLPPSTALSTITCTSTLAFPTGWNNFFEAININLACPTGTGQDCITYNSTDLTTIDWHDSQFLLPTTGAAHHFSPSTNNGESFVGFVESFFRLGHAVPVVSLLNPSPDPSKGIGVLFTVPHVTTACGGGSCSNGNGVYASNKFQIAEVNGGTYGIKLDNPAIGSGGFTSNEIISTSAHNQSVASYQIGTSALPNTTTDTSWGNSWYLKGGTTGGSGFCLNTWGGAVFNSIFQWAGDYFEMECVSGNTGLQFNSSAVHNLVKTAAMSTGTPYVNNATAQTNKVIDNRGIQAAVLTVTASPYVYQNKDLKPESIYLTGGTVLNVESSVDGVGYFGIAATSGQIIQLAVGQYVRVTYSVLPSMVKVF